jgi:Tol biopolymer transport system component
VRATIGILAAVVTATAQGAAASEARRPAGTIVWEVRGEGQSVAIANPDGTGHRLVAPALFHGPSIISSFQPMPSPDGTTVVFARQFTGDRGGTRLCIRKLRPPYRRAVCRSRDGRDSFHPVWSPDGDEISFVRRRASQYTLAVARPRRGPVRIVTTLRRPRPRYPGTDTLLTHQAWSPDGSRLVFASGGDVFTVTRKGSRLRNLTRSPRVWDRAPAWSPDGTKIAWLRGGNVHVTNADGSAKTRITSLRVTPKGPPVWAPRRDRLTLTFTAGEGLYVTRNGYYGPRRVGTFPSVRGYAWSPDASHLVVATRFRYPAVWIVSADGKTRRRVLSGPDDQTWVSPSWR